MTTSTTSQLEVCESLLREHRQMEALLAELEQVVTGLNNSVPEELEGIRAIMTKIEPEMNTHFACEEQVLFPAVSPYHPMVLMEAEHEELIELRQDFLMLLGQPSPDAEGLAKLQAIGARFISDMLDHIGREDAGIFPTCERALSDNEKQAVIDGMAHLRAQAEKLPTPMISRPERSFEALQVDLISPAQRAVFSERLLDTNDLEIKHLVIQAGQSIPAHWAPKQGTLICLSGTGHFNANALECELKPGTTVVMTPRLLHSIQAETDCHLLMLLR